MLMLRRFPSTLSRISPNKPCVLATRSYALSRFPSRQPGSGRARTTPRSQPSGSSAQGRHNDTSDEFKFSRETEPSVEGSPLWEASRREPAADPEEGLRKLLMQSDVLVITRQLEMMNVFLGFEQANRYVISDPDGNPLGYVAEEPRGFLASFGRQIFRTHRPFRALILDLNGSPLLWIRRPFAWINSRMFVQRLADPSSASVATFNSYGERIGAPASNTTEEGEPILDTFGEVQQIWHPWRRKYDLFLRDKPMRILSTADEPQPEPDPDTFSQVAIIDGGFWAWTFPIHGANGEELACVSRQWGGFGREIFTDTGAYFLRFGSSGAEVHESEGQQVIRPASTVNMSLEQRALTLATAVNIDFDYFSRHSEGHGSGLFGAFHFGGWD